MLVTIGVSLLLVFFLWSILRTHHHRRKMPPGPFPFPLIGNAHQMGSDPPYSMEWLRRKYGKIYTLTLPVGTFVIVNGSKAAREALVAKRDDFAGRPGDAANFPLRDIFNGKDISFTDFGPSFLFRRKIISSALHVYGEGLQVAEERVGREVDELLDWLEGNDGREIFLNEGIIATMMNIMSEWLFSKRYEFNDPTLKMLFNFNEKLLYVTQQGRFYQAFPFLKYLPTKVIITSNYK